jgi:lytic murein transglycosylase
MNKRFVLLVISIALGAPALASSDFRSCLNRLERRAAAKGVTEATLKRHTRGIEPDMTVIESLNYQPEFRTPIWDYLAGLVDEERIADGREMLQKWSTTLAGVEKRFGVAPATVIAVWGVESNFGKNAGKRPLVTSLATLSCFGRRQSYFRGEFYTALRILQEGHVDPEHFLGSWAGAFGQTQFMPSSFMRLAVDFDGDGRRDIVDSIPDALASTANYLERAGWRTGEPWGFEVRLPPNFDPALAGRKKKRALSDWVARGVTMADGSAIAPTGASAALLLPAEENGPAFLVFRNFDAIYTYNASEAYALAIAHLSDRLKGGPAFLTPWPTDDPGLSRAERREVQTLLMQRGYDIGEVDGMIGSNTREAIQDVQRRAGMQPDGRAGRKILDVLHDAR